MDATSNDTEGQQVTTDVNRNQNQQKWKVVYLDEATKIPTEGFSEEYGFYIGKPFYMRSRLPMQRVAECVGANNVVLRTYRKNTRAQQWIFDGVSKTIKSYQWQGRSLDINGNGSSSNLRVTTTNSRWWQMFRYQNKKMIVNMRGKVMQVSGNVDQENRNIDVAGRNNRINQFWDVIYADEWKADPVKGEMNEQFGLIVEKDFHVVSQMREHRYLDLINNRNMVIKTPNGRSTQVWYFHQQSRTIRTRYNN